MAIKATTVVIGVAFAASAFPVSCTQALYDGVAQNNVKGQPPVAQFFSDLGMRTRQNLCYLYVNGAAGYDGVDCDYGDPY